MESLLNQSRAMCPFLKRTSPAALRSMSIAAGPSTGPRGGTMSNLQVIARRCPIMSKALAVQSSRLASKHFTTATCGVGATGTFKTFEKISRCPRNLHTTAGNGASVEVGGTYEKRNKRMLYKHFLVSRSTLFNRSCVFSPASAACECQQDGSS